MGNGVQPAGCGLSPGRLEGTLLRARAIVRSSRELINTSRELCAVSRVLVQQNTDLQELREQSVLDRWARQEHRQEQGRPLCILGGR